MDGVSHAATGARWAPVVALASKRGRARRRHRSQLRVEKEPLVRKATAAGAEESKNKAPPHDTSLPIENFPKMLACMDMKAKAIAASR